MLSVVMLSVVMLSVVMLSVVMLSFVMLSVVMMSVVMLSVIMQNVAMLSVVASLRNFFKHKDIVTKLVAMTQKRVTSHFQICVTLKNSLVCHGNKVCN